MNTKKYMCPMHPEVTSDKPGTCPKCHMKLVLESEMHTHQSTEENDYSKLYIIFGLILLGTCTLSFRDYSSGQFLLKNSISYFMAGFFLVFSGFKLLDLKGFAEGYAMYDLLAKRWNKYGYIYPFIELFFGLAMLVGFMPTSLLWAEVIIMTFSGIGVLIKVLKKEKFHCACLGTFLKVPLTTITLVEDFGMAILALLLLVY